MPVWTIKEYRDAYSDFFRHCDKGMKAAILSRMARLRSKGTECRKPISEHLENGIFEFRARSGKLRARLLYYFSPSERRTIIFVEALFKKTGPVPPSAIKRAKQIRLLIEAPNGERDGLRNIN